MSEDEFSAWWRGSKYCQVVYPSEGWEQIARDGWNAALRAMEWRAIESAPKDGTPVALYGKMPDGTERVTFGQWLIPPDKPRLVYCDGFAPEEEWAEWDAHWASWDGGFSEEAPPTHWRPLPPSPTPPSVRRTT